MPTKEKTREDLKGIYCPITVQGQGVDQVLLFNCRREK